MGSNTDYLGELEYFLDNPVSVNSLATNSGTSPNAVPSPVGPSPGAVIRDRLRHHLNGAEKRKLEDGSTSDLLAKTQRTDDLLVDPIESIFKSEDIKSEDPDIKTESPQSGFNNPNQGGLLAQALLEKRPSHGNNQHMTAPTGYFGVDSPKTNIGSPGIPMNQMRPGNTEYIAFKQQLEAINKDHSLSPDQKNGKIAELVSQYPNMQKLLMQSKLQKESKAGRRGLGHDPMIQRDSMVGPNMIQSDFGPGFSCGNNDVFNGGPFVENNNSVAFGSPGAPVPRGRGRPSIPASGPPYMSNSHPSQMGPVDMWDMNGKCMNGQPPPASLIHAPPQFPYRKPGMMPANMINSMGGNCYNQPQGDYMPSQLYNQQQPIMNQRVAPPMNDPLYPFDGGIRNFNSQMYPGGGMRMVTPHHENFQNDYIIPSHNTGRNPRHPEFMYHNHHPRMGGPQQQPIVMAPHQQSQRPMANGFGVSPRMSGNIGQMSPMMSPPLSTPHLIPNNMHSTNNQQNVFNNNNNVMSMPVASTNGFHFGDEFLGSQDGGMLGSNGSIDDPAMDSILGMEEPSLSQSDSNWKQNAGEYRRDLLQRMQNALKDDQTGCLSMEAASMEEEAFNVCNTQEEYVYKLAQWLAGKFSLIEESPSPFPDSTTLQESLSCSKLSSTTDVINSSETSPPDMLAKANPILAETLAAASNEPTPPLDIKDSESLSSSSSASASPASSTLTTTTAQMSGLCSPMANQSSSSGSLTATTTITSSRLSDTFHRPSSETVQSADKGLLRSAAGRRASGKGINNNSNNPHSVDSGIGSPRSTASSSLYSPKLHGTSPSLVAVSNSDTSPEKPS